MCYWQEQPQAEYEKRYNIRVYISKCGEYIKKTGNGFEIVYKLKKGEIK